LQAGAGAQQLLVLPQHFLCFGAQQVLAHGEQQRLFFTLQHFTLRALQQVSTGPPQAGAAGAQQAAGAEQPQPFFMKNALASFASNTDRVRTATTMAANAANLRLIMFLPSNLTTVRRFRDSTTAGKTTPQALHNLRFSRRGRTIAFVTPANTVPRSLERDRELHWSPFPVPSAVVIWRRWDVCLTEIDKEACH
jgi:hypothetical protein